MRGPSAGGSGQDNVYNFDGVNVTLPLFGTLSAEPSSHDIAQVTTIKAGAQGGRLRPRRRLLDRHDQQVRHQPVFGRGQLPVPERRHVGGRSTTAAPRATSRIATGSPRASAARSCRAASSSTGRTTVPRSRGENRANKYGELPPYERTRDEGFGKVTFTPVSSVLLNFSYRGSDRTDKSDLFASNAAATTGTGGAATQKIGIAEGSWVINSRSLLTFKYNHFAEPDGGPPRQRRQRHHQHRPRHANRHARAWTRWASSRSRRRSPARRPTTRSFSRSSTATATSRTARASAAARSDTDRSSTITISSGTPDRWPTTSRFGGAITHELHVGYQQYVDCGRSRPQLERLGPHHGRPAGERTSMARRSSTPRGSSSRRRARPRRSAPSTTR